MWNKRPPDLSAESGHGQIRVRHVTLAGDPVADLTRETEGEEEGEEDDRRCNEEEEEKKRKCYAA